MKSTCKQKSDDKSHKTDNKINIQTTVWS